jgi:membrane-bound ClpP family serine protease
VSVASRTGYALFAAAVVLFFVGLVASFPGWVAVAVTACLVAGSVLLAPAIVLGYAVRAAERDDPPAKYRDGAGGSSPARGNGTS